MNHCLKNLLLQCQKTLRNKARLPQSCSELYQELDKIQQEEKSAFLMLSGSTPYLSDTLQALIELLPVSLSSTRTRVLSVLLIFCTNKSLKELLVTEYGIVSALIAILPLLDDQPVIICLKLLSSVSNGVPSFLLHGKDRDSLIKYCSSQVTSGSTSLLSCLEILINICHGNPSTQASLKSLPGYDLLQHKLVSSLKDKNVSIIITSLHLLAVLSLKEQLGIKIFKPSNLDQTLHLILSVVCTSFDTSTVRQAIDLLLLLLASSEEFQHSLAQYPQLTQCLEKAFRRLSEVSGDIATMILGFFISLIHASPELSRLIINVLLSDDTSTNKMPGPLVSIFELLKEEEVGFADAVITGFHFLYMILKLPQALNMMAHLPAATHSLINVINKLVISNYHDQHDELLFIHWHKQQKAIAILSELLASSSFTKKVVSSDLDISLLLKMVQGLLLHSPIINGHLNKKQNIAGSLTVAALSVLTSLPSDEGLQTEVFSLISDSRVLSVLSQELRGSSKEDICIALNVMFSVRRNITILENFCEIHASFNDLDEHYPEQSFKTPTSVTSVNDTHPGDSKQLDQIIDKFKSCVEIQDIHASEIMSVYEHKLQSMMSKENHLQDLLDAKSQAMLQADRLLKQYRARMDHIDSECHKLRRILQETEQRNESLKDKIITSETEHTLKVKELETQKNYLKQELEQLKITYSKQSQKLEDTENKLIRATKETEQLNLKMASLNDSITELESELTKKQSEMENTLHQLNSCQSCLQSLQIDHDNLKSHANDQMIQIKNLGEVKIGLERSIDELNQQLTLAQNEIQMLTQQAEDVQNHNTQLQNEIVKLKKKESDLEHRIDELSREVDLFSAVKTLINRGQT